MMDLQYYWDSLMRDTKTRVVIEVTLTLFAIVVLIMVIRFLRRR